MNLKRILSVIIALAMVIGTMGFTALAAGDTTADKAVASIGDQYYSTVALAIADAAIGSEIDLCANITGIPTITKAITIDGNNHHVTAKAGEHQFGVIDGEVIIKNIVFDNGNEAIRTDYGNYGDKTTDYEKLDLTLENCTFNALNNYAVMGGQASVKALKSLTVKGCIFNADTQKNSTSYMLYAQNVGTLVVNDCTFNGHGVTKGAIHTGDSLEQSTVATISGNKIDGVARGVQIGNRGSNPSISVSDNSFTNITTAADSKAGAVYIHSISDSTTDVTVSANSFDSESIVLYNDQKSSIDLNKMLTFATDNKKNSVAITELTTAGTEVNITASDASAATGVTTEEELRNALATATSGDTVVLAKDIIIDGELHDVKIPAGVTFDGGNHSISIGSVKHYSKNAAFYSDGVCTVKNLTISAGTAPGTNAFNLSKGGTLENVTVNAAFSNGVYTDTGVTVTNCTFNNISWGVYTESTISNVITDCTFNNAGAAILRANDTFTNNKLNNSTLSVATPSANISKNNISDGKVEIWNDNIDLSGNYWGGTAPSDDQLVKHGTYQVNDYYTVVNEDGTIEEDSLVSASSPVVAKIGDVYYSDIQEAIKAAAPSGTVDIIADITVDTWNMFSQSKTIGNGKIITLEMDGLTINGNDHSLTVKSVESAQNGGYLFDDPDNFTIRDLTINVENNGGIGLKSGTVDNVTFNGGNCIFPGTGKVTITNCTFNTDGHVIYYEDARDNLTVKNNTFNVDSASNVIILYGNETFTGNKINSGRTVNAAGGSSPTISGNTFAEGVRLKVYNTSTADIYGNTITVLAFNDETPVLATFENNTMSEAAQAVLDSADLATLPNAEVVDLGAITIDEYRIYNGSLTDGGDPIDLQVAMEFIAKDTPEEAAANAFGNYTTDFFISFEGMANDSFVADGCYLAGNYGTFDWIMIPLDEMTIKEGVIYPVITSVGFDFSYEDICTSVKDFKCGIYFSDEVIAANPDLKVKLELGLSEDIDAAQAAEFITVDQPYVYAAEDFGYVAKIGETKFATLQNAVDAATDGQTITMIATANLDSTVIVGKDKNIILDLNGKNINTVEESEGKHFYAFNNNGTLTVKDTADGGEINARGNYNYGKMIVEGGTINAIDGNGGYGVRNYNGASLTVSGGKIATTLEDDNKVDEGGYDATPIRIDEGATLEMNAGEINNICDYTFGIENYGTTTIEGGSVTTVHTTLANYGDMTINGGTFTNEGLDGVTAHVVWAADGNTTINGGTFDGKDNYNGFNIDASEGAVVNISGGEFKAVHSGSLYGDGTIAVSGGSFFDKIPEERIESGFVLEANSDGTYGVKANWITDTDSGCYGDKSVAMMRFLFALGITDAIDVEKSGIKYIAGNDISAEVKGTSDTGASKAFYGDVIDVPEAEAGNTYYAVAYITTVTGKTYWSNPLGCTVNFDKFFSAYNGGNN